ncbi:MAG: Ig-like domain-containing protein [Oscillospiraceae bacterium]|nr:Ig-like domain-containing protein [Oscillospiraceae bacterium]
MKKSGFKTFLPPVLLFIFMMTGCGVQAVQLDVALPERINVGEQAQAVLTAVYDKPEAQDEEKAKAFAQLAVVWASSDETVAAVDETGKVTGMAEGTAVIIATAGDLTAEQEITVSVPLEGIEAPELLELAINKTNSAGLGAKPVPENAYTTGVIAYTSSNEAVAMVDEDGTVTAKADGEAVISMTLDGKTAKTKVQVTTAATGIALEKNEGILYVGGSYAIKPYIQPDNAPESTYTFKSENEKVATVNETGVMSAKNAGTAEITVTSAEGFTAVYTLTVKNKPAANTGAAAVDTAAGGTVTNSAAAEGGSQVTGEIDNGDGTCMIDGVLYYYCQHGEGRRHLRHCQWGCNCTWVFEHVADEPTCSYHGCYVYACTEGCGLAEIRDIPPLPCDFSGEGGRCRWCGQLNDENWQKPPERYYRDGLAGDAW